MKSRQQKQIIDDLLRFVNIMNDLLDVAALHLKEINEETGGSLQVIGDDKVYRRATTDELISMAQRKGQNVLNYYSTIDGFIAGYGEDEIKNVLSSFNYDPEEILSDISAMRDEAEHIINNVGSCSDKSELVKISDHIDSNIPKLTLVRRSWCIGK